MQHKRRKCTTKFNTRSDAIVESKTESNYSNKHYYGSHAVAMQK